MEKYLVSHSSLVPGQPSMQSPQWPSTTYPSVAMAVAHHGCPVSESIGVQWSYVSSRYLNGNTHGRPLSPAVWQGRHVLRHCSPLEHLPLISLGPPQVCSSAFAHFMQQPHSSVVYSPLSQQVGGGGHLKFLK